MRARLTFVPNTLGLSSPVDAGAERLLKNLLDEDTRLFRDDEPRFLFAVDDENEGTDEATRDLLEEIDRSLRGFEKATVTHSWLGDAGLNADERQLAEASGAHGRSRSAGVVDLAGFVADAVRLDGGSLVGSPRDDVFTLVLPAGWRQGLEGMPGVEPDTGVVRLTTRLEATRDTEGRPVGFVGRAHPLVRRALERVRHVSFTTADAEDARVSAVRAPAGGDRLLYTFLGRLTSSAGREFERVLAVEVSPDGRSRPVPPDEWMAICDPSRAVRAQGLWETRFAPWAAGADGNARTAARAALDEKAAAFTAEYRQTLEVESRDLEGWIAQRAKEVIGDLVAADEASQPSLFGVLGRVAVEPSTPRQARSCAALPGPAERLAGFASDHREPSARRSEADGALRIYRQRREALDARLALAPPELLPLGLLMIVAADGGAQ